MRYKELIHVQKYNAIFLYELYSKQCTPFSSKSLALLSYTAPPVRLKYTFRWIWYIFSLRFLVLMIRSNYLHFWSAWFSQNYRVKFSHIFRSSLPAWILRPFKFILRAALPPSPFLRSLSWIQYLFVIQILPAFFCANKNKRV